MAKDYVVGFAGGYQGSWPCNTKMKVAGGLPVDSDLYPSGRHTHEANFFQEDFGTMFDQDNRCASLNDLAVGDKIAYGRITLPQFASVTSLALRMSGAPGFKVKLLWENGINPGAPVTTSKQSYNPTTKACTLVVAPLPAEIEATNARDLYIVRFDENAATNLAPEAGRLILEITALPTNKALLSSLKINARADFLTRANPQYMSPCPCECEKTCP